MKQEIVILILSALPVTELRASIPIAITVFHFSAFKAWSLALFGNLVPIPFLWWGMPALLAWAEKHMPRLHAFLNKKLRALEQKHMATYQRFGAFALAILGALPLPGAGIWTGTALAVLFDIKARYAIPAIIIGHVVASVLVVLVTTGTIKAIAL